ncbi:9252_t:CDS:2, partial [Cetraspora pellucida]
SSKHVTTKFTPFLLTYGRELKLPIFGPQDNLEENLLTRLYTLVEDLTELTETKSADVIVEPPSYDYKNKTRTKVYLTYQALRSMAKLRNHEDGCLKTLAYAYYLGELLETKPKTPAQ